MTIILASMEKTKKQVLPTGLWVVSTPIGNLEDMSSRGFRALEEAQAILCEDTRETAKLLTSLGISKPYSSLIRLDAHASQKMIDRVVERLSEGQSFALVTDAGTPAISDPGAVLVASARQAGIQITPIPGPSAVMSLLSICGFTGSAFVFRGFFPRKSGERQDECGRVISCASSGIADVFVWFESPHRVVESLEHWVTFLEQRSVDIQCVAAKELTKLHERFFAGTVQEVCEAVKNEILREGPKGEWCFGFQVLLKNSKELEAEVLENESLNWMKALQCLIDSGISASEAAKQVSQHFGVPRKKAYETVLKISGKKVD